MQGFAQSTPLQLFHANPLVVKEEPLLASTSEQPHHSPKQEEEVVWVAEPDRESQSPPGEGSEIPSKTRKYNRRLRPESVPSSPSASCTDELCSPNAPPNLNRPTFVSLRKLDK